MLKIWERKKQAEEQQRLAGPSVSAAQIRLQTDIDGLELPPTMDLAFPDSQNIMEFELSYRPDRGYYAGGRFTFRFNVSPNYPIEPPKVKLLPKIWHPNIDLQGAICLNILREDWKPVLSLYHVVIGLQFLFLEPNCNDPLNQVAAQSLQDDPELFGTEVRKAMQGGIVHDTVFDYVLA